jgi:hypothetical protein
MEVSIVDVDVMNGGRMFIGATVPLALAGRFSKASRIAVGHSFGKISQARRRSAIGSDVGAACVRARRKKKVVVR